MHYLQKTPNKYFLFAKISSRSLYQESKAAVNICQKSVIFFEHLFDFPKKERSYLQC